VADIHGTTAGFFGLRAPGIGVGSVMMTSTLLLSVLYYLARGGGEISGAIHTVLFLWKFVHDRKS
jgi:hypothetical protein